MREILEKGDSQVDAGHGHATIGVFGRQMRFDLSKGFPLLTTKKVFWKGVVEEMYWFLSGQNNIKYLVDHGVHIWDDYPYRIYSEAAKEKGWSEMTKEEFVEKIHTDEKFANEHGILRHIYGELWRSWPAKDGRGVDQLQWAVNELKTDPSCHNAIVTSWNPEYLYTMAKAEEVNRYPICHNMYQFNIKHGKLSLQLYQRSADIFLGVPFNIASYALLCLVVAKIIGREPGEFVHTFGDVHIYDNLVDQVKEQLTREPKPLPKVTIADGITLETFRPEHVTLENYDSHPPIKGELTVAGFRSKDNKPAGQAT